MKNHNKIFTICIIVSTLFSSVFISCEDTVDIAEYGTVSGQVKDAVTDIPLSSVTISTNPASNSIVTDDNGNFLLENVPVGEVTVTAKKLDYKTYTVNVKVQTALETTTNILLERSSSFGVPSGNFIKSFPVTGSTGVTVKDTLHWQFVPDREVDSMKYTVKLFESPGTMPVYEFNRISDTFAVTSGLRYNTTYYWQVMAVVDDTAFAKSDLWTFTTEVYPENPILFAKMNSNNYDIWSVDTTGQILLQVTNSASNIDWCPKVNPVNGNIAFVSNRNLNTQIYIMNNLGENQERVTTLPVTGNYNQGTGYCWSPDGSMLLYPHYDKLYRINADGTGLTQVATAPAGRHFTSCDWSNYTGKIVAQTTGNNPYDNEIYLMNENGSEMLLFVENLPGIIQNPVFTIDGQKVMYTRDISGLNSPDGRQLDTHIFIRMIADTVDIDISDQKPEGTNDLMPRFSPDGSKIIFVNSSNVSGSRHDIYISDAEGKFRHPVFEDATMPEWRKTGISNR
ncbi:MAG TPA: carboxypeptidase-like regulatory domain-containing protein [Lentimicrobium sp.]|nr:carboxypeptidase-like regulatory domain-containing protein [Lentimicrobium sp.]